MAEANKDKKESLVDKIFHHDKKGENENKPEAGKKESEFHKVEDFAKKEGKEFAAYDKKEEERERNDEIWGPGGARG